MFRKPFSVKKNTSLRNSDAKKLLQRLPEEGVAVLPKKVLIAHVKLLAFNGAVINVYVVDREPMFFDFDDSGFLFPTLYFSWIGPTTFPTLVVHESVLRYLENGADLMLQGGLYSLVEFYFELHVKRTCSFKKRKKPLFQLLRCFLAAVKFRLEKLPMDVGQFYSTCLLKCVPSGRRLDMKKTKYKKFSAFLNESKMTKTFVLRMPDGRELVRKINMPKIIFKVETRSGNKKVTLINNLEVFGIDTKKLCQQIQVTTSS
uniref:Eukaryotic translation initiation factor 2D n=1 Tax=Angiostrongylus cantonensis TaxID=6313 RepID=A0A0K0CU52_ANGCA